MRNAQKIGDTTNESAERTAKSLLLATLALGPALEGGDPSEVSALFEERERRLRELEALAHGGAGMPDLSEVEAAQAEIAGKLREWQFGIAQEIALAQKGRRAARAYRAVGGAPSLGLDSRR